MNVLNISFMKFNLEHIQNHAEEIFHRLRWGDKFRCPYCQSDHITPSGSVRHPGLTSSGKFHHCNTCNHHFSDTSGTIFHSTKLPLWKWLCMIYYFLESPHGISSYTLAKYISVSQPTAWRMLTLLRQHLHEQIELRNETIIDEAYFGTDWHFVPTYKKMTRIKEMERKMREENPRWTGPLDNIHMRTINYRCAAEDKMQVAGILNYTEKKLELIYIHTISGDLLLNHVKMRDKGIKHITTDQSPLYSGFPYPRSVCNHKKGQYKSDDGYSSNPIENIFSLIRRTWHGVYHWWRRDYCQGYLNEVAWRYNHRLLSLKDKLSALFSLIITNGSVVA